METSKPDSAIENDVLHLGSTTKLTPEQIAKAIAHHKHHHGNQPSRPPRPSPPAKSRKANRTAAKQPGHAHSS